MTFDKDALDRIMIRKKLSIRKLAKVSGLSKSTIQLLKGGKKNANLTTIKKLTDALGVCTTDLVKGEDMSVKIETPIRIRINSQAGIFNSLLSFFSV